MKTFTSVFLMLLLLVAFPVFGKPQQHAPTVEVCSADVALWYDVQMSTDYLKAETLHITDGVPNRTPTAKLSLTEVNARTREMGDCYLVTEEEKYHQANLFYAGVQADRLYSFISRHHLMEQLRKEDAQGLR